MNDIQKVTEYHDPIFNTILQAINKVTNQSETKNIRYEMEHKRGKEQVNQHCLTTPCCVHISHTAVHYDTHIYAYIFESITDQKYIQV